MNKKIKNLIIALTLIIALSIPASIAQACGRNHHHARHHFYQRHQVEQVVTTPINDGSFTYYHNVLGMNLAHYLIQIKKMP